MKRRIQLILISFLVALFTVSVIPPDVAAFGSNVVSNGWDYYDLDAATGELEACSVVTGILNQETIDVYLYSSYTFTVSEYIRIGVRWDMSAYAWANKIFWYGFFQIYSTVRIEVSYFWASSNWQYSDYVQVYYVNHQSNSWTYPHIDTYTQSKYTSQRYEMPDIVPGADHPGTYYIGIKISFLVDEYAQLGQSTQVPATVDVDTIVWDQYWP